MFDLQFYNMISKANKLINDNHKQIYKTFSNNKRKNRFDEVYFLQENAVYLVKHIKYFL